MKEFYSRNKRVLNIIFIVLGILLIFYLVWTFYISKIIQFNKQVENLKEAGQKYFEMYTNKIPSNENGVSTVSAKELYEKQFVESKDLYIPKTSRSCDLDNSWVKARREDGKIQYYTYLKCGNYENDVDHEGPEITLNGEKEVTLDINEAYEEAGVKSVVDKEDGELDVKDVTISDNEIDSSSVGTYEIRYTAYDSLRNRTTVKRTVKVVRKLDGIIKEDTNNQNYYSGADVNNYVQFSGMLWRIVGINEDGTIKLITNDSVSNVTYGNQGDYDKTNIYKWLNDYFYDHLQSKDYIVKNDWCVGDVSSATDDGCKDTKNANVGLLTLYEYQRATQDSSNYLASVAMGSYWLANKQNDENSWVVRDSVTETFKTTDITTTRPVINIDKNVYAEKGDGSSGNPYFLGDYTTGNSNSKLNDRLVGERVEYSGYNWIIMDTDKNGTTLIMTDSILDRTEEPLEISYDDGDKKHQYNIEEKGNIGYQIEREVKDYLVDDDKIIENEWAVVEFDSSKTYDDFEKTSFKSKYSIPKSYDMFSATVSTRSWLIDYSKTEDNIVFVGPGGRAFDMNIDEGFENNAVRLVIKLDNSAVISSGEGTDVSPYSIK